MRILIYEPLADIVKAPFFSSLGAQLASEGHDVIIACEQKVIYTLQGRLTEKGVINCTSTICAHIASNKNIRYTCFMPNNKALYKNVSQRTLADKLNTIARYRRSFYTQLLNEFNPDLIYIWNGQAEHQQDFVMLAKNLGFKFNYLELGWFPQKDYYYIDESGVNARSTLAQSNISPLNKVQKEKLNDWINAYTSETKQLKNTPHSILVPLQVDSDSNITNHSPFKTMLEFIRYLENNIPEHYQVVLRPHPKANYAYQIKTEKQNFSVDSTTPLFELICKSEFVLGINSTVLLESLIYNKKVIPLGHGILKKMNLSLRDETITKWITKEMVENLLFELIFNKQVNVKMAHISPIPQTIRASVKLSTFNNLLVSIHRALRATLNLV